MLLKSGGREKGRMQSFPASCSLALPPPAMAAATAAPAAAWCGCYCCCCCGSGLLGPRLLGCLLCLAGLWAVHHLEDEGLRPASRHGAQTGSTTLKHCASSASTEPLSSLQGTQLAAVLLHATPPGFVLFATHAHACTCRRYRPTAAGSGQHRYYRRLSHCLAWSMNKADGL